MHRDGQHYVCQQVNFQRCRRGSVYAAPTPDRLDQLALTDTPANGLGSRIGVLLTGQDMQATIGQRDAPFLPLIPPGHVTTTSQWRTVGHGGRQRFDC